MNKVKKIIGSLIMFLGVFVLSAGISNAQVTCDFYMDPNVSSGTHVGTASNPFNVLNSSVYTTYLNPALASANKRLCVSARAAGSDTDQTDTAQLLLLSDGPFILTIDGISKYNSDDTTPSWHDYNLSPISPLDSSGNRVTCSSNCSAYHVTAGLPITTNNRNSPYTTRSNIVLYGIKGTMSSGGSKILEIASAHDISILYGEFNSADGTYDASAGPGVIVLRSKLDDDVTCTGGGGIYPYNITFQYVRIRNTVGEGLYVAGTTNNPPGCNNASTSSAVHIYDTDIYNPGLNSSGAYHGFGQGDGIDIKDGITGLEIKRTRVSYSNQIQTGIQGGISLGSGSNNDGIIEGNFVSGSAYSGISSTSSWTNTSGRTGFIFRNNLIVNSTHSCFSIFFANSTIINNTFYQPSLGAGDPCVSVGSTGIVLVNNIMVANISGSNEYVLHNYGGTFTTHDYNTIINTGNANHAIFSSIAYTNGEVTNFETHSKNTDPSFVSTSAPYDTPSNFKLSSVSSTAYNNGTNTNCASADYFGTVRPASTTCDMGFAEYITPNTPVPGNSGIVTTASVSTTTLTLNWTKATHPTDMQNQLQYEVGKSTSNNVTSVAQCEAATIIRTFTADINTFGVTGLTALTPYYFCVVVMDTAGNKVAYSPVNVSTTCGADHLTVTSQPSNSTIGVSVGTLVVVVKNAAGTTCTDSSLSLTFSKNASATWGTLNNSSGLTIAASSGVVSSTGFYVTGNAGSGSIDISGSGVTGTSTSSITISSLPVGQGGGAKARGRFK